MPIMLKMPRLFFLDLVEGCLTNNNLQDTQKLLNILFKIANPGLATVEVEYLWTVLKSEATPQRVVSSTVSTLKAALYQTGQGCAANDVLAVSLYEDAIQAGDCLAMYHRAAMYVSGEGYLDSSNVSAAMTLLQRAVDLNYPPAMIELARMLKKGNGQINNVPNSLFAMTLLDRAVALHDLDAINVRAQMHMQGVGEANGRPNFHAAIKLNQRGIDLGSSESLYFLAELLIEGKGQPDNTPNLPEAFKRLDQAIILGNTTAMFCRGDLLLKGRGEPDNLPNYPRGFALLQMAIDAHDPEVMTYRAKLFIEGQGEPGNKPNYKRAFDLLTEAMGLGYYDAVHYRAELFADGVGEVDNQPNLLGARELLIQSIVSGDIKGLCFLASILLEIASELPEGCSDMGASYAEAITLLDKAVIFGDHCAMVDRASLYTNRYVYVQQDPNDLAAIDLLDKAVSLGDADAMIFRAKLYSLGIGEVDGHPNLVKSEDLLQCASFLFDPEEVQEAFQNEFVTLESRVNGFDAKQTLQAAVSATSAGQELSKPSSGAGFFSSFSPVVESGAAAGLASRDSRQEAMIPQLRG